MPGCSKANELCFCFKAWLARIIEADSRLKSLTHATGEIFINQRDWNGRAANAGLETLDVVLIRKSAKSTTPEPQPG